MEDGLHHLDFKIDTPYAQFRRGAHKKYESLPKGDSDNVSECMTRWIPFK